jgi:hypothetical protein
MERSALAAVMRNVRTAEQTSENTNKLDLLGTFQATLLVSIT